MFFHANRMGWLGMERYVGHEIVGWKVSFRRGGPTQPLQHVRFPNPSRFGVLRQLIRDGRAWHGRVFYLEVATVEPLTKAHYELVD